MPIFKVVYLLIVRRAKVGPNITEVQKEAISKLPPKMTKRCKTLMRQLICFSPLEATLSQVLTASVSVMKPIRADWLVILNQLNTIDHNLYLQVIEFALAEESFEANVRDYTKIVHNYGMENRLEDAEKDPLIDEDLSTEGFPKTRPWTEGFWNSIYCILFGAFTILPLEPNSGPTVHMYSKVENLKMAEETFEELKLLGQPLDKRSYGSMIMAYVRVGML
ncbi:hypothetical protein UlMin_021572 [Ulmus minor]